MNTRIKYSAGLISLGLILALIPFTGNRSISAKPSEILREIIDESVYLTPDQVARLIASEDSTLRLIDVRAAEQFNAYTLPGALNAPYKEFLKMDPAQILGKGEVKNVLFSNGDTDAAYSLVLAKGMNFKNVFIMKGGMNGWYETVMNSSFSGERISARENALFESRTKAKRLFTEFNTLPDSLKLKLLESKKLEATKLDGGCE